MELIRKAQDNVTVFERHGPLKIGEKDAHGDMSVIRIPGAEAFDPEPDAEIFFEDHRCAGNQAADIYAPCFVFFVLLVHDHLEVDRPDRLNLWKAPLNKQKKEEGAKQNLGDLTAAAPK